MKTDKSQYTRGYTLIELLVGIVIISIVFSIGYAGYRQFSRRQALTGVSKSLTADLRLAQQLALTGQKPLGVTCRKLVGYTFDWASSSSYSINASCDNTLTPTPDIDPILTKSVTLPSGVSLTQPTTDPILFKVLGQGTNLTSNVVFRLTSTGSSIAAQITVATGGNVVVESTSAPAAPTSSPVPTASPAPTAGPTTPPAPPTASPAPTAPPK